MRYLTWGARYSKNLLNVRPSHPNSFLKCTFPTSCPQSDFYHIFESSEVEINIGNSVAKSFLMAHTPLQKRASYSAFNIDIE